MCGLFFFFMTFSNVALKLMKDCYEIEVKKKKKLLRLLASCCWVSLFSIPFPFYFYRAAQGEVSLRGHTNHQNGEVGLQRTIWSSSESPAVAPKTGMGHFHSQESGGCSYRTLYRLVYCYMPSLLGELVLLVKWERKMKGPCGEALGYICLQLQGRQHLFCSWYLSISLVW